MDHYQYLILMAACLVATLPLEALGARVWRAAPRPAAPGRAAGRPGLPGLGRAGHRRARVELQPPLRHRGRSAVPHPGRRAGLLPGHPGVRHPHLPGCAGRGPADRDQAVTGLGYTVPAVASVAVVVAAELAVLR